MTLIVKDRVRETSTTSGTGTITLLGPTVGFQSFSSVGDGNTTYYAIVDAATGVWEVGIGTYTLSGTTLSRNTVLESSNANALVNFGSGTKDVFVTYPAEKSVYLDESNNVTIPGVLTADFVIAKNLNSTGAFTWDSSTSSPASVSGEQPAPVVTEIHKQMKGCVLNADGTVNYYLDESDWSKKADGTASDLTGADGNVMVEIPKFYYQSIYVTTRATRKISPSPASGFVVHPAFIKDGVEVDYRYAGAYDACVYDVSASAYISGLNYDNNDGANGVGVDVTASTGDKLASVKGVYPMVGLTRAEFRTIASNVGAGWRQMDFDLWSVIQLLYLVEYQSFYSQAILGAGNTNGSYLTSSGNQSDSPHTIAGAGDALANGSTDVTSGAGVNAKPGTSFMKYRGIENLYGNCWTWSDGININVSSAGTVYVTNNATNWADNTSTNYDLITSSLPTTSGYIRDLLPLGAYSLASNTSGGGSSTYITDYLYGSTTLNRVVLVGGSALSGGAGAGAFCVGSGSDSSDALRAFGARLAF